MSSPTAQRIAQLNDQFRRAEPGMPGKTVLTAGIIDLLNQQKIPLPKLAQLVANYSDFNEDNDPHGEHDFGAFELGGAKCYWKIDAYDPYYMMASDDPTDLSKNQPCADDHVGGGMVGWWSQTKWNDPAAQVLRVHRHPTRRLCVLGRGSTGMATAFLLRSVPLREL